MSESALRNKVMAFLKKNCPGAWIYKASDRFTAGIPDIIMLWNGRFYAFELKSGLNKPTKLQQYIIDLINDNGGYATSVYDLMKIKEWLEKE